MENQINFLWRELNLKREMNSKSIHHNHPKTLYVFEYMNNGRSSIEFIRKSNTYADLPIFNSIQVNFIILMRSFQNKIFKKKFKQ